MKRLLVILALAFTAACSTATPGPGQEAVWVEKPWFFGHGGTEQTPVKTGQEYGVLSSDVYYVNMQPQRVDMAFSDMMTASGVPVDFHVVISFKTTDSVKMVTNFGTDYDKDGVPGFFTRNLDQPIRTSVREHVKAHDMQDMAITAKAVDEVQTKVRDEAIGIVKTLGVPIEITSFNVGRVNPPDDIKHQRIATATQEQRIITEQQTKLAEDQRKKAEESRADADNAYNQKMQLTPTMYVELERIKMLQNTCAWQRGNCTFFVGGAPELVKNVSKQ